MNQQIYLNNIPVGTGRAFIIAEVGSNHGGSLETALAHIDAAAEAGADAVKFQSLNLDHLYLEPDNNTQKLFAAIELETDWYHRLNERCNARDVAFFSSPTYFKAVELLEEVGVPFYKLASAQVSTFPQLVRKVAAIGKPVLFSTGVATYGDAEKVVEIFREEGNQQAILLHCNSLYPTPPERVYLGRMETYRKMFDCIVGYSDHTDGTAVSVAAATLGASVIEKHFVLDRTIESPDAAISITPKELARMVREIRVAEVARNDAPRTHLETEEAAFKETILYRLVLDRDVNAGEQLGERDFRFLRHEKGVDCRDLENVITYMCFKNDARRGTLVTWEMLEGKA